MLQITKNVMVVTNVVVFNKRGFKKRGLEKRGFLNDNPWHQ